jgi:hypothetical protein
LIVGVIVRGNCEGAVFEYGSLQSGEHARGYPRLGGGPRPADQIGDKVVAVLVGVFIGVTVKVHDFYEARDNMHIFVEVGRENFWIGL